MLCKAHTLVFLSLSFLLSLVAARAVSRSVTAKSGKAEYVGFRNSTYDVDTWLGVRYAVPPTGVHRLQPPQPINDNGVVNATHFSPTCFQVARGPDYVGINEDCLSLNIYKPATDPSLSRKWKGNDSPGIPVMVFLHGGGFNDGTGQLYGGESLANQSAILQSPIIVVTINYRLSFLGWSGSKEAAALNATNLGLLDQRQALLWLHDNIAAFGGDPTKITLAGQSAGATSLGLHMNVPENFEAEPLFRAAIFESGSAESTVPTPPPEFGPYQDAWDAIIDGIGCTNSSQLLSCIQAVPAATLFPVISKVALAAPLHAEYPFEPVTDGKYVRDYPSKLIAAGRFAKIPTMLGDTTDEVTYAIPTDLNLTSEQDVENLFTSNLPFIPLQSIRTLLALNPLSQFPNPSGVGGAEWYRTTQIASDLFDRCPGREFLRNISQFAPAYKYRYNAVLPIVLATSPELRIGHGAELPYVFGPSYTQYVNGSADTALSHITQKAWISFVSYMDPNRLGDLGTAPAATRWPRFDDDSQRVLVFQKSADKNACQAAADEGGLFVERDRDDRASCDFLTTIDDQLQH